MNTAMPKAQATPVFGDGAHSSSIESTHPAVLQYIGNQDLTHRRMMVLALRGPNLSETPCQHAPVRRGTHSDAPPLRSSEVFGQVTAAHAP